MSAIRRAVIDIGTNSVKLLVADVLKDAVEPVLEDSEQTRLGAGFFETHRLQPPAIAHSVQAVAKFAAKARELSAVTTRVIATSAARDAVNPTDLTSAIESAAGLRVEIISGKQEAEWAFRGVQTDPQLARLPLALLDVGGGSTEFILGQGERQQFRQSFQLGTVRLLEKLPPSDPPTAAQLAATRHFVRDFLDHQVRPELEPALRLQSKSVTPANAIQLVGTGGSSTILARMEGKLTSYERSLIDGMHLSLSQIRAHTEKLWSLSLVDRRSIVGLPKSRADVILSGVVIYESVMEAFGFSELRVSTRGLRFAAVMNAPD